MVNSYRPRRGSYALSSSRGGGGGLLTAVIALLLLCGMLYGLVRVFMWISSAGTDQRAPAQVQVERGGSVNVMIDGGEVQAVQDGLPLYPGDILSTGADGHVRLTFFDGTVMRLDEETELKIVQSEQAPDDESAIEASLTRGRVWLAAPDASGSLVRTIATPALAFDFAARTEAVVGLRQVAVYDGAGLGAEVHVGRRSTAVMVGEGQSFILPDEDGEIGTDLYQYRAALAPGDLTSAFLSESRQAANVLPPAGENGSSSSLGADPSATLTITQPAEGAVIRTGTVAVAGTVGEGVARVRVNGYQAAFNAQTRAFSQELAVESGQLNVLVEALDEKGLVMAQLQRSVTAEVAALASPTIIAPAATGQTYRTQDGEITLRGGVPAGTQAVEVNGYRLQLYKPGNTTWSYLARTDLGNLVAGRNEFNVVAINGSSLASPPATLVVLVEAGQEGVVATGAVIGSSSSSVSSVQESDLPKNDPIRAGSLQIVAPTAGTQHTMSGTGSEILIEGTTIAETDSVWVNGYKLQLYKAGKTTWNYIARESMGNLKKGQNVYRIVTRDKQNAIIDILSYTVTY
ncbi:MAG: FecR domain-containing protein [Candidatus Peribacteraceae bacterium]|nr:FecR domain-containing protein [Candidatus Peribacteraceae bacterium]